ncbi:MAG: hypothetical protein AB8H12_00290 [Lewinella sp.]
MLSAQDTLLFDQVDTKPQLRTEDIPVADGEQDQEKLFLIGIYSTVIYPRYARDNGVRATIKVAYIIDVNGELVVDETRTLTPEEATNINVPKKEMISIVGYSIKPVNNGTGAPISSPWQTKSKKRLAKAHKALEDAAVASLLTLPKYIPGSHEGNPITVRKTLYFDFRLE